MQVHVQVWEELVTQFESRYHIKDGHPPFINHSICMQPSQIQCLLVFSGMMTSCNSQWSEINGDEKWYSFILRTKYDIHKKLLQKHYFVYYLNSNDTPYFVSIHIPGNLLISVNICFYGRDERLSTKDKSIKTCIDRNKKTLFYYNSLILS
jgi:hypothetical protein